MSRTGFAGTRCPISWWGRFSLKYSWYWRTRDARWRSSTSSTWSNSSRRTLPTNRSATAFIFGARTAVRITLAPTPWAARSNAGPNLSSRSRSSNALRLDREHEAFCDGIQIGTAGRKAHTLYPGRCEHATDLVGEQRIPVVKQVPLADQKSVDTVGEVACDLRHPPAVRLPHHAARSLLCTASCSTGSGPG